MIVAALSWAQAERAAEPLIGSVVACRLDELGRCPERLVGNAHHGLGAGDVLGVERQPVGLVVVGVIGGGVADVAAEDQQRWTVGDVLGGAERRFEPIHVVGDLAELDDVPSVGPEALGDVVVVRQRRVAVDRDVVVVVDADQLAEPEMAGERGRLVRDALHEAPVAGDHVRVMVDRLRAEVRRQEPLGDRHADRVAEALTERSGGDLDPRRVAGFGMPRGSATPTDRKALMSSSSSP